MTTPKKTKPDQVSPGRAKRRQKLFAMAYLATFQDGIQNDLKPEERDREANEAAVRAVNAFDKNA